jgi:hypothetical protein
MNLEAATAEAGCRSQSDIHPKSMCVLKLPAAQYFFTLRPNKRLREITVVQILDLACVHHSVG